MAKEIISIIVRLSKKLDKLFEWLKQEKADEKAMGSLVKAASRLKRMFWTVNEFKRSTIKI